MDDMQMVGQAYNILKNASNMAKKKYLLQGATQVVMIFSIFVAAVHVFSSTNPGGKWAEIGIVGALSLGALIFNLVTIRAICVDAYQYGWSACIG
jgi:hypothetical protein